MSFRELVTLPLRRCWHTVKPILLTLDHWLVALAVPFGVHIQPRWQRFGVLMGIYLVIYLVALLPVPVLPLAALLFGYLGVIAVGRAWVANEKRRAAIVKKLDNTNPDSLPDLRGSALLSALQLIILFPLLFRELQERFDLFKIPAGATFLTWMAFTFDTVSRSLLEWFGPSDPSTYKIEAASFSGRLVVLLKRLTVDLILIQGIIRIFAITTTTREGVEALRQDTDMTRRLGKRAVESLIELLASPDTELRRRAALVLGELRDQRAVEPLIARLQDADSDVRWQAAESLGILGDPRAVQPLLQTLGDPEQAVRSEVVDALELIAAPESIPPLIQTLLGDGPGPVRAAAAEALKRLKNPEAVPPLIQALKDGEAEVCRAAAEALGPMRDPRAVGPLLEAVADPSVPAWVRYESCRSLEQLRDGRAVQPLLQLLADADDFLRKCAIHALGRLRDTEAVPPLLPALSDAAKEIREAVAIALGELKDARASEGLVTLLSDPDENVRVAASTALEQINGTVPTEAGG